MYEGREQYGFTLVEFVVSLTVLMVISMGFFSLFVSLVNSTNVVKQRAVAGTLATNQVEYLRSLPYDNLAVSGGSIISNSYIPSTTTKKVNNITYKITTSISYVDDAYDGCGSYPSLAIKKQYCRNFSSPGNSAGNNQISDTNPADYKSAHVVVFNSGGTRLAAVDTQVAARVAETASTTGALFVQITDSSGTAVIGANVSVKNNTVSPQVNASDLTDSNGMAIFYGLPPDTGQDYVIKADKSNFSSIYSIASSGSLQPVYSNQKILSQQSSYLAMVIGQMSPKSLLVETTDVDGAPLPNVKVNIKGGYKKYTASTDTSYYFDTMTPTDTRPVTDGGGLTGIDNLPPINSYLFCGPNGGSGCTVGGTTYYLAAAMSYSGANSLAPIAVPIASDAVIPTYVWAGGSYVQKVRLMLTPSSSFPRVFSVSPDTVNKSDNLHSVKFVFSGYNLNGASAKLTQNSTAYTDGNCIGNATQLTCNYDLSLASAGDLQITVQNSNGTLILPISPNGGIHVKE